MSRIHWVTRLVVRGIGTLRVFVYYGSKKRELKRRLTYEYRCDERLKTKKEESTRLSDTGFVVKIRVFICSRIRKGRKIPGNFFF
jgi:hypothetical protein